MLKKTQSIMMMIMIKIDAYWPYRSIRL